METKIKKIQQIKCEVCKEKIIRGEPIRQLDDMVVCISCYETAVNSDSWAIRPENYPDEDMLKC